MEGGSTPGDLGMVEGTVARVATSGDIEKKDPQVILLDSNSINLGESEIHTGLDRK